jgi:hypothetical protein
MGEGMEAMMPIMRKSIDKMTARAQEEVAQMRKDSTKKTGESAAPAQN